MAGPSGFSRSVSRRTFLGAGAAAGAALAAGRWSSLLHAAARPIPYADAPWIEATVPQMQAMMNAGHLTSRELVQGYLARIEALDPLLHAVIETNPQAVSIAARLDDDRRAGSVRGPLHGIPILVKDNIATERCDGDDGRVAGARRSRVPRDAPIVAPSARGRRRDPRQGEPVGVGQLPRRVPPRSRSGLYLNGWSARGGFTRNPYDLGRDPCGSSSGSAVAAAANLCAAAVGTETDGSIVCPSGTQRVVGLKPTVGPRRQDGHHADRAQPGHRRTDDPKRHGRRAAARRAQRPAAPLQGRWSAGRCRACASAWIPVYFRAGTGARPTSSPSPIRVLQALEDLGAVLVTIDTTPELAGQWRRADRAPVRVQGADRRVPGDAPALGGEDAGRPDPVRQHARWQEMQISARGSSSGATRFSGNLEEPEYVAARQNCILNSRTLGIDKALTDDESRGPHRPDVDLAGTRSQRSPVIPASRCPPATCRTKLSVPHGTRRRS